MHILRREALASYNTLALEARASALVHAGSESEVLEALSWAVARKLAVVPLGEGSNVVIAGNLDALVLRIETRGIELVGEDADTVLLRVAAGEHWHSLVEWTIQQGYYGLENLALIPGTVGAAPIQNIGAYGVELAPFVRQVHCVCVATGEGTTIAGTDCRFGYRDSIFKHSLQDRYVITAIDLQLARTPAVQAEYPALARELESRNIVEPTPRDVFEAVVQVRRSKLPDPVRVPNAGSFFKNPVVSADTARDLGRQFSGLPQYPQADGSTKLPAAWLIDHCGWKGHRRDNLGIHPEHALVIVNYGNTDGAALLSLAAEVAASVLDTFGIALEIEPRIYGAGK